jgi:hypothetical protein
MNYTYELKISQNGFNVIEFRHYRNGEISKTIWLGLYFFSENSKRSLYFAKPSDKSFFRTKKWLVNNHSELLL